MTDLSRMRLEADDAARHNSLALRVQDELVAVAKETAGRTFKNESHLILMYLHITHDEFARTEPLDDSSLVFARNIDNDFLKRLGLFAIFLLENDLRLRDLHLVPFAAHIFKKNGDG